METNTDNKKVQYIVVSKTKSPEDAKRKLEEKKAEDYVSEISASDSKMSLSQGTFMHVLWL